MSKEIITFLAKDNLLLNGYINKCEIKTDKILIATHGMTSNCLKKRESVISDELIKLNIDTMVFDNRGSEIMKYCRKENGKSIICGTAYEDVEEGYFDIVGAIYYAVNLGYKKIYLQGHSLGATKVLYTYNKMQKENHEYLKYIKSIILLSLIDIPDMMKTFTPNEYIELANKKESENKVNELMPFESTIYPLSVKTFLKYIKYNQNIDFARYHDKDYEFQQLKNIEVPLFMRWGNDNELIKQNAEEIVELIKYKLNKKENDINFIDGANHSYKNKEKIIAKEIGEFLNRII